MSRPVRRPGGGGGVRALVLAVSLLAGGCGEDDGQYLRWAEGYYARGELRAAVVELKNVLQRDPDQPQARQLLGRIYMQQGEGVAAEKILLPLAAGQPPAAVWLDLGEALLQQGKYRAVLESIRINATLAAADQARLHALRGEAYLGLEDIESARAEYQTALRLQPNAPAALVGLGRLAVALRQLPELEALLQKLTPVAPQAAEVWSLWGDYYRLTQDLDRAEAAYSQAIAYSAEGDKADYLNRALLRIAKGDLAGAGTDVDVYLRWSPQSPFGFFAKGMVAARQGRYEEAQVLLSEALARKPDYMPVVFYLGTVEFALKQLEQAQGHLSLYLTHDPDSGEVRTKLAAIYLEQKKHAKARQVLEPYLAAGGAQDAAALKLMADIALAQGDTERRIEILNALMALEPQAGWVRSELGITLVERGDWEQGIRVLQEARQLDPQSSLADSVELLRLLKTGKPDEALKLAERLSRERPEDVRLHSLRGVALLEKDRREDAQRAFHQALGLAPGEPLAALGLAQLALAAGDLASARDFCQAVLKHHPGHLPTLLALAALETSQGNRKEARRWLEQALQADPDAAQPRAQLALGYLQEGQPQRALDLVRDSAAATQDPLLLQVLGEALLADGQLGQAAATLEKLVGFYPRSAQARFLLARAYAAQGNQPSAQSALEEALRLDPAHLPANVAKLRQLALDNRNGEAQALLAELKRAYPAHPEVALQEGWLAYRQGRYGDAARLLSGGLAKLADPTEEAIVLLAQAHWRSGAPDQAIAVLSEWIAKHPQQRPARRVLGNFYLAAQRLAEAQALYAEIIQRWPNDVVALNNLAELLRRSEPAGAQRYAERALRLEPNNPQVMDTLAMILLDRRQPEDALPLLERAVKADPQNPTAQYHLALALAAVGYRAEAREALDRLLAQERPFTERPEAQTLRDSLAP